MTLFLILEGSQHVEQGPVETFYRVPSRMVRGGSYLFSANELTQFFYCSELKVGTLVTVEFFRDAIMDGKVVPQALGHCPGFLIRGGDGHCIFRKMVGNDQNVLGVTRVRLHTEKIHAHKLEWSCSDDVDEWCGFLGHSLTSYAAVAGFDLCFHLI